MSFSPAPQTTFCALCALPCLCLPDSPSAPTPSWLHTHTSLRLSFGPIPPPPPSPPPPQHGQSTWTPTWNRPPAYPAYSPSAPADAHRSITLHTYCLSAALRLERSEHGKSMLQAWSLPKWTGWMEWGRPGEFSAWRVGGVSPSACEGQGGGYGRWEVERWANGQRHYLPMDLISPADIPPPVPSPTNPHRPRRLHRLSTLPPHILLQIADHLLDSPPALPDPSPPSQRTTPPPVPSTQTRAPHPDLQALLNTSSDLRYIDFPHSFWAKLVRCQVDQYKHQLLHRYTASPTRAISSERLEAVLEEEFSRPVEEALEAALSLAATSDTMEGADHDAHVGLGLESGLELGVAKPIVTAREVYSWWAFSPAWRSRRRVWRCVVYGCAQARDADWL
ncbi:uncharacterized protein MKK02DRAFT_43161 [Dioszegia hungarica]|uniref:F-box domain-containing protein n=1 Tax=Dioszegia hungarica TaxID=4972 RepID=A0AA38HE34_9TREE|nr:uncharacterized protein MKK02DRAFT_43161 [Dioszegia hungarica]KAI9637241.1 hypothetical protein MKK02DRAFT_43161 [Dioszegia hungarica]